MLDPHFDGCGRRMNEQIGDHELGVDHEPVRIPGECCDFGPTNCLPMPAEKAQSPHRRARYCCAPSRAQPRRRMTRRRLRRRGPRRPASRARRDRPPPRAQHVRRHRDPKRANATQRRVGRGGHSDHAEHRSADRGAHLLHGDVQRGGAAARRRRVTALRFRRVACPRTSADAQTCRRAVWVRVSAGETPCADGELVVVDAVVNGEEMNRPLWHRLLIDGVVSTDPANVSSCARTTRPWFVSTLRAVSMPWNHSSTKLTKGRSRRPSATLSVKPRSLAKPP
ncbi:hypothetical protein M2275_008184 [Rhodococcus opacus]|nr:hypothetical protein [Rhodococcus opacus]